MAIAKKQLDDAPRERLRAKGAHALSDEELLALLLQSGGPRRGVREIARSLLDRETGLYALSRVSFCELTTEPGLGAAKSASLVAAFEMGRRIATRRLKPGVAVRYPADVYRHFHPRLRVERREHFLMLLLDGRQRFLREATVSQGTLTASLVHPREVFREALRESAASMILVHNHPSGDPTPSAEDLAITARLVEAGDLLGVPIVDHVIVAEGGFSSLRELGDFPKGSG